MKKVLFCMVLVMCLVVGSVPCFAVVYSDYELVQKASVLEKQGYYKYAVFYKSSGYGKVFVGTVEVGNYVYLVSANKGLTVDKRGRFHGDIKFSYYNDTCLVYRINASGNLELLTYHIFDVDDEMSIQMFSKDLVFANHDIVGYDGSLIFSAVSPSIFESGVDVAFNNNLKDFMAKLPVFLAFCLGACLAIPFVYFLVVWGFKKVGRSF